MTFQLFLVFTYLRQTVHSDRLYSVYWHILGNLFYMNFIIQVKFQRLGKNIPDDKASSLYITYTILKFNFTPTLVHISNRHELYVYTCMVSVASVFYNLIWHQLKCVMTG